MVLFLSQAGRYKESEEVRQSQLENLREIEEALDAEFGGCISGSEVEFNKGLDFYCAFCEKAFRTELVNCSLYSFFER